MIYYLRNEEVQEAFELLKDLEPSTPQEYILKGVVNANIGQARALVRPVVAVLFCAAAVRAGAAGGGGEMVGETKEAGSERTVRALHGACRSWTVV